MAFLRNDAINCVNLHSGVQALAQGAGHVFVLVFLLKAGVSVPLALLAEAGIVAGRFALRPLVLPLARRFGLKPLLITGVVGLAVPYPFLAQVEGVGWPLAAVVAAFSIGEVFYWLAYNAYYAAVGDPEHRGHQVGLREALVSLANIAAPLLGAWGLASAGPHWTFALVGLVQATSALPLLGAPNVPVQARVPGAFRAATPGMLMIAMDGWLDASFFFVWQVALFVALGESFRAYGGALALSGLVGAACAPLLGRYVDRGHARQAVLVAYAVIAGLVLMRAASLTSPWLAVTANALSALAMPLLLPSLASAIYNLSRASPCPFRFAMATEAGWDIGCFLALVSAAALLASGASLAVPILLGLPGVAVGAWLLWRQFPRKP